MKLVFYKMELSEKIKNAADVELEDLPDLYPYCALPRERKIICYVGFVPKNFYPDEILRLTFSFDIALQL